MLDEQLKLMHERLGFIAALDQSGGSTPKALANYGVYDNAYTNDDEMFTLVHEMRTRIVSSPVFTSEHILGAILFENTMDRKVGKLHTADYLWKEKQIIPFLKIDKGLAQEQNGVQMMKDMPELDALLEKAVKRNIFGTKMRSVIKAANEEGIQAIVKQQFDIAKKVIAYKMVPIIEPEVDIHIDDKALAEDILLKYLYEELHQLDPSAKVIFKLTIPTKRNLYAELMKDERVVRVVALSGGYGRKLANRLLGKNKGLIASFSRALLEGLHADQTEDEFNQVLAKSIKGIYKASIK